MAKLLDLVESHPDVIVSIRAADLLAANEELIRRTRQELEQLITDANTETYRVPRRWRRCSMLINRHSGAGRRLGISYLSMWVARGVTA